MTPPNRQANGHANGQANGQAEGPGAFLGDVRVLDLSMHVSGPYATLLLGDLGADVVKVEPRAGDPHRKIPPFRDGRGVIFTALNRGKRGICLDLKQPAGRDVFLRLAADSDVVFNNFRPGVMERLGLSFEEIRAVNPRVVYASLSGFGATGPRRDTPSYDTVMQAFTGGMSVTGHPGGLPTRSGIPIADIGGGIMAAFAITAALHQRDRTGEAVSTETSLFDGQLSFLTYWAAVFLNSGTVPGPQGSGNQGSTPYGAFEASDGYVMVASYPNDKWIKLCHAIDREDLLADERYTTNLDRLQHRAVLEADLTSTFRTKTVAEWVKILEDADVPGGPVNDMRGIMAEEQTRARDMRIGVHDGDDLWEFVGNPIKAVDGEAHVAAGMAPHLGEHTGSVLHSLLGLGDAEVDALERDGAAFRGGPEGLTPR